ncbi:platelet-activating factor acetylhydrolase 2, cytoplasmic-like [Mixophyes fleayi]|uniref:platelet-activating factor acetylhydrolase 2, cytoplasmic-like n=1 Tax=Mixophyes fleayi TaxID=3061075 RepID=UPI003F4E3794
MADTGSPSLLFHSRKSKSFFFSISRWTLLYVAVTCSRDASVLSSSVIQMRSLVCLKLPPATGPYQVGCTDVMVGSGKEGSFFRLFYPCSPAPAQKQHPLWVPRSEYIAGLMGIRGWDGIVAQYGASVVLGSPKIPVTWNGNVISGEKRSPLVIFSHGLGSFRTVYSSLCMELASYGFLVAAVEHRIDFSRVAVMGHSFGGATALLSLIKDDIFRCAVVLDPWMFPLEDTCFQNIQKPILSINTENFQTNQSVQKLKRLNSLGSELKYLTVLGCVHQSQTDFAFLTGYLANKIVGPQGTMDPHQCLAVTVTSSLDFLHKHLDLAGDVPKLENLSAAIQAHVIPDFPLINNSKL